MLTSGVPLNDTVKKRSFGVIGGPAGGVGEGIRISINTIVTRSANIPTALFQIMRTFHCNPKGIILTLFGLTKSDVISA